AGREPPLPPIARAGTSVHARHGLALGPLLRTPTSAALDVAELCGHATRAASYAPARRHASPGPDGDDAASRRRCGDSVRGAQASDAYGAERGAVGPASVEGGGELG